MRFLLQLPGAPCPEPSAGGGGAPQPGQLASTSGQSHNTAGWEISRAVLIFGIICVAMVWLCACLCILRHAWRRWRRSQPDDGGNGGGSATSTNSNMKSAASYGPRFFAPEIPVVIIGPDGESVELGVKEDGVIRQEGQATVWREPRSKISLEMSNRRASLSWGHGHQVYPVEMAQAGVWLAGDPSAPNAPNAPNNGNTDSESDYPDFSSASSTDGAGTSQSSTNREAGGG